jgi:hypothetical protein
MEHGVPRWVVQSARRFPPSLTERGEDGRATEDYETGTFHGGGSRCIAREGAPRVQDQVSAATVALG